MRTFMATLCIHCALRAFVKGEPVPLAAFDESLTQHMRRCHPDPFATRIEREELEKKAREKVEQARENDVLKRQG